MKIAGQAKGEYAYWGRAIATALAQAALLQFKVGEGDAAKQTAEEAIQYFATAKDPSMLFENLIRQLRVGLEKKASS
jgi:hypothetical protein